MLDPSTLLTEAKSEMRVTHDLDDSRILGVLGEGIEMMQKFKSEELTTLSFMDKRWLWLYCRIFYRGETALKDALSEYTEHIRTDNQ